MTDKKIDESWKKQVESEKDRGPIPQIDFISFISMLATQVLVNLGVLAHPETGQPAPDLEGARMTIDILEMIAAKTKGNLTAEEDGALTQILSELRMGYVRVTQSQKPT